MTTMISESSSPAQRLAGTDQQARAILTPALDGPQSHQVWLAVAFLLGAMARDMLGDSGAAERAPVQGLTHGETRVLQYLPTYLSAREIAGELYLSVNTVKTHQRHLYQKLGARTRSQAVEQARASGLLAPSRSGSEKRRS